MMAQRLRANVELDHMIATLSEKRSICVMAGHRKAETPACRSLPTALM
jgi:hypothetical protein